MPFPAQLIYTMMRKTLAHLAAKSSSSSAALLARALPRASFASPASAPAAAAVAAASATLPATPPHVSATVQGERYAQYLDCASATVGMVLESPFELTFRNADRVAHQAMFYEFNRVHSSAPFAKSLGFADIPMPGSLLLAHAGAMSHVDTSREVWDLGFKNAVYVRPVMAGDTLTKSFCIQSLRNTTKGDGTIMSIKCELFNQFGKLVFTLDKQMLFKDVTNPFAITAAVAAANAAAAAAAAAAPVPASSLSATTAAAGGSGANVPVRRSLVASSVVRETILENAQALTFPATRPLVPRQCLLHVPVVPLGTSRHLEFCTRHRLSHPLHVNLATHAPQDLVLPGMAVVNLVHAATNRSLYEVLHETTLRCDFLDRVAPTDAVGAVTFIEGITEVPGGAAGRVSGLADVRAVTLGVKNIDVCRELAGAELPTELFTREMRAEELDAFLAEKVPALRGKVVLRSVRSLLRQSLYARAEQIPLL